MPNSPPSIRCSSFNVRCSTFIFSFAAILFIARTAAAEPAAINFSRDILPILSDTCFACHGPDQNQRKADLRLDTKDGALRTDSPVILPGKSGESELVARITSTDPNEVMPPPKSNRKLTAAQIELLKRWIDEGAAWGRHWAYEAPRRPELPAVKTTAWARNSIDRFILARLEREGLAPSPEAPRETLIRRLSLDLTGLSPTPDEVDAFLRDGSDQAYETVVDRLLNSPRYGERMAWDWLDAARYADTNGYQGDPTRSMWHWRDWVIDALNRNMPFDQFTVEQLAGDLLPNPTRAQLIATGFHRNHMINGEGGRIAEESRVDYVQDRVETTGTVWMGLTLNCCRCHDHKFDPLAQREYYQLSAYFNSIDESGGTDAFPQARPVLPLPTPEQESRIAELRTREETTGKERAELEQKLLAAQTDWEQALAGAEGKAPQTEWVALVPDGTRSTGGATLAKNSDGDVLVSGQNPEKDTFVLTLRTRANPVTGFKLEALPDPSLVNSGPGRADNGNFVLTEFKVEREGKPLKLTAVAADYEQGGFPLSNAIDGKNDTGWAVASEFGKTHTGLFEVQAPVAGKSDEQNLTITLEFQSVHISHVLGKFRISATSSPVASLRPMPDTVRSALAVAAETRNDAQKKAVSDYYLSTVPEYDAAKRQVDGARQAREQAEKEVGTTMILRDLATPRDTFILVRGAYDKFADKVTHGVPAVLPALAADAPANRLALARWLVSPDHPLMARVTVNRYWQTFFGTGLVKTAEDFGVQGEKPSHPELLDWLACEFVESGWNVKHLQRLIVTSAAYRQSSKIAPALYERDPENRLVARGPRYRLPSWMIRDQALDVGGLLVDKIGGKGVQGYQPPGIWEEATFGQIRYNQEHGDALYRRSLYTFWRRIVGPTMFFDVANRQTCTVKIARTNTPLHALATLNDVTYVEAARGLAQRTLLGPAGDDGARITEAFRRATARPPKPAEVAILTRRLAALRQTYAQNEEAANKLLAVGESKPDPKLAPPELAAWTSLVTILLNLDETISKE
ncbi:MAG: PSD1 domain-containing protein [Planctomycetia bacterium]|nr:PSD1 domain-containing protein [Planctomycetia bacterium]